MRKWVGDRMVPAKLRACTNFVQALKFCHAHAVSHENLLIGYNLWFRHFPSVLFSQLSLTFSNFVSCRITLYVLTWECWVLIFHILHLSIMYM